MPPLSQDDMDARRQARRIVQGLFEIAASGPLTFGWRDQIRRVGVSLQSIACEPRGRALTCSSIRRAAHEAFPIAVLRGLSGLGLLLIGGWLRRAPVGGPGRARE